MTLNVIIDAVALHTNEYSIQTTNGWGSQTTIKPGYEDAPLLNFDSENRPIRVSQLFNLSDNAIFYINHYGLIIRFRNNEVVDLREKLERIKNEANDLGLNYSGKVAICRLDLARDSYLNYPYSAYKKYFKWGRSKNTLEYPHSYTLGTKKEQIIFYDKGLKNYRDGKSARLIKNLLRSEVKMLNKSKVQQNLGFHSIDKLVKSEIDFLSYVFIRIAERRFFKPFEEVQKNLSLSYLPFIKSKYKTNFLFKWLAVYGYDKIEQLGIEELENILVFSGIPERSKFRLRNQIVEWMNNVRSLRESVINLEDTSFQELKSKIIGRANSVVENHKYG